MCIVITIIIYVVNLVVNIVSIMCRTRITIVAPTQHTGSLLFVGLAATPSVEPVHVILVAGGFVRMVSTGVVAVKSARVAVMAVRSVRVRLPITAAASVASSARLVAQGRDKLCLG